MAYARSFGIGIVPILQSLEQIKNMYKDEWGVIIDNCNTLLYLGSITHMDTLEYMSKLLGKGTFDKRTTGLTKGRQSSSSQNFDEVGRELMLPSEIREMPKKDCLLVVGGRPGFYSEKYEYTEHPNYRFTSDANKEYSYHFTPAPNPALSKADAATGQGAHREERVALTPSANSEVEVVPVKLDDSPTNMLSRMTKNASSMALISDHDLDVDEGDNPQNTVGAKVLGTLIDQESYDKERAQLAVSQETKAYMEALSKEKIRMEEGLIHTVNRLGRTFRNLTLISEEEMKVPDGEGAGTLNEKFVDYIMDSDEVISPEELSDILDDAGLLVEMYGDTMEMEL